VRPSLAADTGQQGAGMLAALIWVPAVSVAIIAMLLHQPALLVLALVSAMLVHTLFRPIAAIYILLLSVPLEWMFAVLPGTSELAKPLGIFALLISLPRIMTAAVPTRWDRSGRYIVLLILWALLGTAWARYPSETAIAASSMALRWGLAVLICVHLVDKRSLRIGIIIFALACVTSAVVFLSRSDVRSVVDQGSRLAGTSIVGEGGGGNVNEFSRMYGIAIFAFLVTIIQNRKFTLRLICVGSIMILCLCLLILKTRSVWMGLPITFVLAMLMLGGAGVSKRILLLGVTAIIGGVLALLILKLGLLGHGIVNRFESTFSEGTAAGGRSDFWMKHLEAFVDTAMVGTGLGQMMLRDDAFHRIAHNNWFGIAGELGIIGLILFTAFTVSVYQRIRRMQDVWPKLFCLLCFIFMLIVGQTSNDYVLKWNAIAVGFMLATIRIEEQERTTGTNPFVWQGGVPRR
jgi:O-antigen ligase